jgi:hypothetical protein
MDLAGSTSGNAPSVFGRPGFVKMAYVKDPTALTADPEDESCPCKIAPNGQGWQSPPAKDVGAHQPVCDLGQSIGRVRPALKPTCFGGQR